MGSRVEENGLWIPRMVSVLTSGCMVAKSGKNRMFSFVTFETYTRNSKWIPFLGSTDHFLPLGTLFDYPPTKLKKKNYSGLLK